MTPIARWLKDTRLAQANPETGRPWTQDYFLAVMKAETGWAPAYPNYNAIEQGKTNPRADTVAKLVAFWETRGVAAPDLTPPAPVLDPMERIAAAVENIARSLELLRTDMAGQSGATIGAVQTLGAQLTATLEGMRAER